MLTKLSLFSGIGGDDLASEWAGIKTIAFVERDKYCQLVLKKHWPSIPIIGDVKDVTKETLANTTESRRGCLQRQERDSKAFSPEGFARVPSGTSGIDIISGGFPCQPHSVAGKRKGSADERNLWPEFARIVKEIMPRWVVAENVPGLFSSDNGHFFGTVISDLAEMGYSVGWCTYGAVDVGAWHRRDRVFIMAYASNDGCNRNDTPSILQSKHASDYKQSRGRGRGGFEGCCSDVAYSELQGLQGHGETRKRASQLATSQGSSQTGETANPDSGRCQQRNTRNGSISVTDKGSGSTEPRLGRVADGLPCWLDSYWEREPEGIPRVATGIKDRVNRLKCLGNAVVPQQIYPIYKAIVEIENG